MVYCNVQRAVYTEFGDFTVHQLLMFVWHRGRSAPNHAVHLSFQTSVISASFTTAVLQCVVVIICQHDPVIGFKCFWKQCEYMICLGMQSHFESWLSSLPTNAYRRCKVLITSTTGDVMSSSPLLFLCLCLFVNIITEKCDRICEIIRLSRYVENDTRNGLC